MFRFALTVVTDLIPFLIMEKLLFVREALGMDYHSKGLYPHEESSPGFLFTYIDHS